KGIDERKDQSYFLFSLQQAQLRRALTPLGKMSKVEIRAIARKLGLKVADKADSQEICFVPGRDYKAFLRSHLPESEFHRGGVYDLNGQFLGTHDGIEMFTIGQRNGLRVRLGEAQKAITPGQAAVFYDNDVVLGGGWICRQAALVAA